MVLSPFPFIPLAMFFGVPSIIIIIPLRAKQKQVGGCKFKCKKKSVYLVHGVKEFACLSVTNFDLNYLRTGEIEWAEIFGGISLSKRVVPNFFFSAGGQYGLGRHSYYPVFRCLVFRWLLYFLFLP